VYILQDLELSTINDLKTSCSTMEFCQTLSFEAIINAVIPCNLACSWLIVVFLFRGVVAFVLGIVGIRSPSSPSLVSLAIIVEIVGIVVIITLVVLNRVDCCLLCFIVLLFSICWYRCGAVVRHHGHL